MSLQHLTSGQVNANYFVSELNGGETKAFHRHLTFMKLNEGQQFKIR